MKILMINKFLYPNGGSETYIFKLGTYLKEQGNEVQYFRLRNRRYRQCQHHADVCHAWPDENADDGIYAA